MTVSSSRREFLAGAALLAGGLGACQKRAARYYAWLFMASADERGVVVSDLSSFRRSGVIPVGAVPDWVLEAKGRVFAVCAESRSVVSIDPLARSVQRTTQVAGKITAAALTPDGDYIAVATSEPSELVLVETATGKVKVRVALPAAPTDLDMGAAQAAILLRSNNRTSVARVSVPDGVLRGVSEIGAGLAGALQYRADSRTVFVAASDDKQIVSLDAATGAILARAPVPISPARFCADSTGGQVFVTGGHREEQLVVYSPFQNQVEQTIYAGRALTGMAVAAARNLLFLTGADGDVSMLSIDTFQAAGFVRTGGHPREVLIAASVGGKDEEYAFVVDGASGDVSVLHLRVVLQRTEALIANTPKPVFTVFHGGGSPRSAVIVPYTA